MDHIVYLALGSNMGNRMDHLKTAVANLAPQMNLKAKSLVYETVPWGYLEQGAFLNQVVKVETYLEARSLLRHLKRLERALGRTPTFENGPRVIDIDILFFDNEVIREADFTVPHPRLHERAFVLVPLADIAGELIHPVLEKPVKQILSSVDVSGVNLYE